MRLEHPMSASPRQTTLEHSALENRFLDWLIVKTVCFVLVPEGGLVAAVVATCRHRVKERLEYVKEWAEELVATRMNRRIADTCRSG